jgi:hypothetical protein
MENVVYMIFLVPYILPHFFQHLEESFSLLCLPFIGYVFLQLKPFFFSFDNKSFICYRFISWFDCNRGIFTIVTLVFVITSIMECSVIYRTKFPLLKDKEIEPIVGWDFSLYFVSFNQFSLVIWRMGIILCYSFCVIGGRLLTESTLVAVIKSERQLQQAMSSASKDYLSSSRRIDFNTSLSPGKLVIGRV